MADRQCTVGKHLGGATPFKVSHSSQRRRVQPCKSNGGPVGSMGPQVDYTQLFQESQNNIMRLNQSRLNALSELKSAHHKIADLEKRLGEATAQLNAVNQQSQQQHQDWTDHHEEEETWSDEGNEPPQEQEPQKAPEITLAYSTGWKQVYIHFKRDGQGWTDVPGWRLEPGTGSMAGHQVANLPVSGRIEFVMNNGEGSWDTPEYGSGSKNYIIDGPGNYFLKSGKVQRLH